MTHLPLLVRLMAFLMVTSLMACGHNQNSKGAYPQALIMEPTVDTSLIAVIPFNKSNVLINHFEGNVTPTTLTGDDLKRIEVLLNRCISRYNSQLREDYKQQRIDLITERYKRQYVAVINDK